MANFQWSPVTSCFLITPICLRCCVTRSLWFLWKKLIALFSLFPLSVSIFELNFGYFKLLQQFLLIFHFWEVFIIFYLRHSTKTPFPFVLWTDLACSPHPAQHESGCAVLLCQGLPKVMLVTALLQTEPSQPWCCSAELTVYLVHEYTPNIPLLLVQKGSFVEF